MITPNLDSHVEHRKIYNVGVALARKSKIAVIEYKTPSTLSTWTPNVYVDVAVHLPRKFELLQLFKSQIPNFYFDEMSLMAFHIDYQCQKRGLTAIESFRILGAYL
jgi:LmbE family N-acetylglucosaminyl deacetylase